MGEGKERVKGEGELRVWRGRKGGEGGGQGKVREGGRYLNLRPTSLIAIAHAHLVKRYGDKLIDRIKRKKVLILLLPLYQMLGWLYM